MKIIKLKTAGQTVYQLITGVLVVSFDEIARTTTPDSIYLYRGGNYRASILVQHSKEFIECLGIAEAQS